MPSFRARDRPEPRSRTRRALLNARPRRITFFGSGGHSMRPPAEGSRVDRADFAEQVRTKIERACGAPVVQAATAPGGFSPGLAARIVCADGRRWFVKAASGQVNPDTPRLHRQEARILGDLDPLIRSGRLPAPRLRPTVEHGSQFALILDDIDGQHPGLPWEDGQAGQVLGALDRLADVLTPASITAPAIGQYLGADFTGWRTLARTPAMSASTPGRAPAWLVLLAPSVSMQGGPPPADLRIRSRAGRSASHADLTATLCALAGYFTERSLRPESTGRTATLR